MEDYLQRVGRIFPVSAESTDEQGNVLFALDSSACMPREHYRMHDPDMKAFLQKDVFPQAENDSRWITSKSAKLGFPCPRSGGVETA